MSSVMMVPACFDQETPGTVCSYHQHRVAGRNDCWNLRDQHGDPLPDRWSDMGLMTEEKLRFWKNCIREGKPTGLTWGQMINALLDNGLQALNIDRSRELESREQEIRKGLAYLRTVAAPDPDDYWQSIDGPKAKFTIDMLNEMLAAKPGTPKWYIDWEAYEQRITEEFDKEIR